MQALISRYYRSVRSSIAFLPTLIALIFAGASFLVVRLQATELGDTMLEALPLFDFRDINTARSILAALVGGVMSLTVFSFSMVMIVLSRAASNLSPRVMDRLVGERAYQQVLGVYVGTTVYCLLLLINVERSEDVTGRIPSIGVVLGVAAGVLCIALFVYFIHHIAEGVKPRSIIRRIRDETAEALKDAENAAEVSVPITSTDDSAAWVEFPSPETGYFQGVHSEIAEALAEANALVTVDRRPGDHVLAGSPLFRLSNGDPELADRVARSLSFYDGESVRENWYYGFRQLGEVAVKALSPGINDPGTAILCINALTSLLARFFAHAPTYDVGDDEGELRVVIRSYTAEEVIRACLAPIRYYGRTDPTVVTALLDSLYQLSRGPGLTEHHGAALRETAVSIIQDADHGVVNPRDRAHLTTRIEALVELGPRMSGLPALRPSAT